MLARSADIFTKAFNMQYAVGAFNTANLEVTQAIVQGAQAQQSPVIVQTSEGAISYAGLRHIVAIIQSVVQEATVPVVMHLDHGRDPVLVKQCIDAGYGSVMMDASKLPLMDNIRATKEIVDYAHERGVWVEAELGAILGAEGLKELQGGQTPDSMLTDPAQAKQFVEETGVDALAVSVGTIHGAFSGQEYIRFELLHELERILPEMPLVVHGASGIADVHLKEVAASNVCKINVDTELRIAIEAAIKQYFTTSHEKTDYRDILGPAREAAQHVVEQKIALFGSSGKAQV